MVVKVKFLRVQYIEYKLSNLRSLKLVKTDHFV